MNIPKYKVKVTIRVGSPGATRRPGVRVCPREIVTFDLLENFHCSSKFTHFTQLCVHVVVPQ